MKKPKSVKQQKFDKLLEIQDPNAQAIRNHMSFNATKDHVECDCGASFWKKQECRRQTLLSHLNTNKAHIIVSNALISHL